MTSRELSKTNSTPSPWIIWGLVAVVILALGLRIWGIDFGLPYLYHPDEPNKVEAALRILRTGDLTPHYFNKPSFLIYINALAYVPYYLLGKVIGVFQAPADILPPLMLTMGVGRSPTPSTFLLGRLLTATVGVGVVVLNFVIAREMDHSSLTGILSALLVAVSPTCVMNSRYITTNMFLMFFAQLSFLFALRLLRKGHTWDYILSGAAAGLAASSKYPGALIGICLIVAHFLRHGWNGIRIRRFYLGILASIAAFFAVSPFVMLDFQQFALDLGFEARHYATGHAGMEGRSLIWYLTYLFQSEGVPPLLAAIQIIRGIRARSKEIILLSSFLLIYFVFISLFPVRNDRTALPLIPFLFVLASILIMDLFRWLSQLELPSWRITGILLVAAVMVSVLLWPLIQTVHDGLRLTTVDARETARLWIEHNLPAGAKVAIESYAPFVDPERYVVRGETWLISHPPDWYVDCQFDYLVFGYGMYGRFFLEPERYTTEVARYEELFESLDLVRIFNDGGYEVRIYSVPDMTRED